MGEGLAKGHRARVLVFIVRWRVVLVAVLEYRWLVDHDSRGRQRVCRIVHRFLERREIDERFEHRSWLPARRDDSVVLRFAVRAAADEGEDVACPRIDGDERDLRLALFPLR